MNTTPRSGQKGGSTIINRPASPLAQKVQNGLQQRSISRDTIAAKQKDKVEIDFNVANINVQDVKQRINNIYLATIKDIDRQFSSIQTTVSGRLSQSKNELDEFRKAYQECNQQYIKQYQKLGSNVQDTMQKLILQQTRLSTGDFDKTMIQKNLQLLDFINEQVQNYSSEIQVMNYSVEQYANNIKNTNLQITNKIKEIQTINQLLK